MTDGTETTSGEEQSAPPAATGMRGSLRAVLGNANLRRVQLAFLGSAVGDWAYATAIVVWAYDAGGASAVGIWLGIRFVLGALTAPIGALYADRWPRKRLMMLTDFLRAILVTGAAVFVALDVAPLVVFVCATLASLLSSPFMIAQRALLPSLSRTPGELAAANGLHSTIDALAFFVGPALAAGLLVLTDVPVVLLVNVVTFLWSLALVSRIRLPAAAQKVDPVLADGELPVKESFVSEALAGFKVIGRDRMLLLTTIQVSLQTVVAGAMAVFLVVMADEILDSRDAGLGYLNAVIGIGSILGGVVAISLATKGRLGRDLTVGVVLWSLPLLLVSVWPTPAACFLAAALLGLANPLVDVNMDTIMQRLAPDEVLGRVFGALESCLIGTTAIGALIMPLLLQLMSLQAALVVLALPVGGAGAGRLAGPDPARRPPGRACRASRCCVGSTSSRRSTPPRPSSWRSRSTSAGSRPATCWSARARSPTCSTSSPLDVWRSPRRTGCCGTRARGSTSGRSVCCATCREPPPSPRSTTPSSTCSPARTSFAP